MEKLELEKLPGRLLENFTGKLLLEKLLEELEKLPGKIETKNESMDSLDVSCLKIL